MEKKISDGIKKYVFHLSSARPVEKIEELLYTTIDIFADLDELDILPISNTELDAYTILRKVCNPPEYGWDIPRIISEGDYYIMFDGEVNCKSNENDDIIRVLKQIAENFNVDWIGKFYFFDDYNKYYMLLN